jgi:hypothetical protein
MGILSRLFGAKKVVAAPEGDSGMVSLVVLLPEPLGLDVPALRQHLDSVFPGHFLPQTDDSFVTEGSSPAQLFVKSAVPSHSGVFFVNFIASPYTKFSEFAAHISAPPLLDLVRQHAAWLSLDLIGEIGSEDDAYRFIGKALAQLAPLGSLAIVHPEKHIIVPFAESSRDHLRADKVLRSLGM